ncbi:MAG: HEAT repeat domain-containing protein [Planctomycetota bacterium]|jgi:HEAT repeat protein
MKTHQIITLLLAFACLTGWVMAGEAPPAKPDPEDGGKEGGKEAGKEGGKEGEKGQDPPAEPKPDEGKMDPALAKLLKTVKDKIAKKSGQDQYKAVEELLKIKIPKTAEGIKELSVVLTLAVNKLRGPLRHRCATMFTELGKKNPKAGVSDRIKAILRLMERSEGKNASIRVCLAFFDSLLEIKDADAEKIVSGYLELLNDYQSVFHLLLKHNRDTTIQIIGDIANNAKGQNLIKRRHATTFLGFWGQGPPLYKVRIPALLRAMKSPVTSAEAIKAIRRIALPDHSKPSSWDRWWKRNEKEGLDDLEIIREDIRDAYERVRGKQKKDDGAMAIAEWIRNWNNPGFKWAFPVLLNPLLKPAYNDKDLRARVISVLGGLGDLGALEPMGKILKASKGEKRPERALMSDIIRSMARIGENASDDVRKSTGALLAPYLDNLFEGVVEAAAEAMGLLQHLPSQDTLIKVMISDTKPRAALKCAEALGKMQAKKALEPMLNQLGKCLEDKKFTRTDLAYHIVKALRLMDVRSPEVVTHLIQAIGSGDERVALEAIAVLGVDWKEKEAVPPIRLFFEDEERNLAARIKALKAIAAYPPEHAAETMFIALRLPTASDTEKWEDARRRNLEKARKMYGNKVKAGHNFHKIAVVYFAEEGHVLPSHRDELITIAGEKDNNKEGRALCVRWLGRKEVWEEERCVDHMILFLDAKDVVVVEAARDVLKSHRTMKTLKALMKALPSGGTNRPTWQEMQKLDVIRDFIFHSNQFNFEDPPKTPDFDYKGKEWLGWLKRVKNRFKFHEEVAKK